MSSATLELVSLHGANRQGPTNSKGVDMTKASGIYRIDLGNDWFYGGSSTNLDQRHRNHLRELRADRHNNQIMQGCFNKYGVFEFVIVGLCPPSDILFLEQVWLDKNFLHPKCVNICRVAGNTAGYKHSIAALNKMSEHAKTSPAAIAHQTELHNARIGTVHSAATRRQMSAKKIGIPRSSATKAKIAKSHKTSPLVAAAREKFRGVPKSATHRKNLSESHKKSPAAKVACAKRKGIPLSTSALKALHDGRDAYWARRREATKCA